MGKKGSWFTAIKRVFLSSSKEKPFDGSERKRTKEKKKGRGILNHGETKSFIPLFRGPSSIEKILGEADEQKLLVRPPISAEQNAQGLLPARPASPGITSPRAVSPRVPSPRVASLRATSPPKIPPLRASSPQSSSARPASPRVASPRTASPEFLKGKKEIIHAYRQEPTLTNLHLSATKIQAAYRGYMARRSFRALRGLVRLQYVVRGHNVKRQTANAMKQMQLLVRVQTQIQSRRIQMLENQALQNQGYKNDEAESSLSKWNLSEAGQGGDWDDSLLTKEEIETRMRRKIEAAIKRERSMAYAYSHQLWKANPRSALTSLDMRAGRFPWWWSWLERQLPQGNTSLGQASTRNVHLTPTRPLSEHKPSPRVQGSIYRHHPSEFDNLESLTPRSSKSAIPPRAKQFQTPNRTPPTYTPNLMKYSRARASAADSYYDAPLKDDDSLTSCPPFSVPNYMATTISAKAKIRANSNPKERDFGTPTSDSKRRFSFPLTPNVGSFKWNRGANKDSNTQRDSEKHQSLHPMADQLSVDSTISMPANLGRKPFNRFV